MKWWAWAGMCGLEPISLPPTEMHIVSRDHIAGLVSTLGGKIYVYEDHRSWSQTDTVGTGKALFLVCEFLSEVITKLKQINSIIIIAATIY